MSASIKAALENAGGTAMAVESEVYTRMVNAIRSGKPRSRIEEDFRIACDRRPAFRDALIGFLYARVKQDMSFRSNADGGQTSIAREGLTSSAAASSVREDSGGQLPAASDGQGTAAPDLSSRDAGQRKFASAGHLPDAPSRDEPNSLAEMGQCPIADKAIVMMPPASEPLSREGGQPNYADKATLVVPPSRDIPLSDAARAMRHEQLRRGPGAGALGPRYHEVRAAIRGESWLLSYAPPNSPRVLGMHVSEIRQMKLRMAKEGIQRGYAALVIGAIEGELKLLGRVSDDAIVEKVLSPAAIARVADKVGPDSNIADKARRHWDSFVTELHGGTHA